jgi:hypothetical protein
MSCIRASRPTFCCSSDFFFGSCPGANLALIIIVVIDVVGINRGTVVLMAVVAFWEKPSRMLVGLLGLPNEQTRPKAWSHVTTRTKIIIIIFMLSLKLLDTPFASFWTLTLLLASPVLCPTRSRSMKSQPRFQTKGKLI